MVWHASSCHLSLGRTCLPSLQPALPSTCSAGSDQCQGLSALFRGCGPTTLYFNQLQSPTGFLMLSDPFDMLWSQLQSHALSRLPHTCPPLLCTEHLSPPRALCFPLHWASCSRKKSCAVLILRKNDYTCSYLYSFGSHWCAS